MAADDDVPIGQAIDRMRERDIRVAGLPAHGFGRGAVAPAGARWLGEAVFAADVGLEKGLDDRHHSDGVVEHAEELFARALGADACHLSTNGSSLGVRAALLAVARPGDEVVVARNAHLATWSGLVVSGARPVYVDPVYDERLQIAHGVDPEELRRVLDAHPQARGVLVASPTYHGVSGDVRGLADVAHARDLPLIVDEAWGLGHAFCSRMPEPALRAGADLTIASLHKSLTGLAQAAVISRRGERVDPDRLRVALELERSTSVSSVLLCAADAARAQFVRDGERLLGAAIDRAVALRAALGALEGVRVVGEAELTGPGAVAVDPTHVTVDLGPLGVTGFAAADWLAAEHGVVVELCDRRRIMVLVGVGGAGDDDRRLVEAMADLVRHPPPADGDVPAVPSPSQLRGEVAMTPREAMLGATEMVDAREATGRVAAEMVCPYPPGVPVLAPGEPIAEPIVDYLRAMVQSGAALEGARDPSLRTVRVVAS